MCIAQIGRVHQAKPKQAKRWILELQYNTRATIWITALSSALLLVLFHLDGLLPRGYRTPVSIELTVINIADIQRRVARFFARALLPSTLFSNAWSSSPCRLCSSKIWKKEFEHRAGQCQRGTYRFELVQLSIRFIRGLVLTSLGEDFLEASKHSLFMEFVSVRR